MDDITLDEIDDLEGNLMDDLELDEIRSTVQPENNSLMLDEVEKCRGQKPLGEDSVEPNIGMEFSSQKMAYDFYNMYGYMAGFSIRMNSFNKTKQGIVTSIRLVCSKSGFNKRQKHQSEDNLETIGGSNEKTPEKQTSTKRCGCKASCHVRLHEDGIWRITGLHKEHNHAFIANTPSKKRHLQSHKHISMEDRADIELLNEQNVGATQIREFLAAKAGGKENLHYSKKDVNNQIGKANKKLVGVDANALID